ncbi:MAG TPA: hypothetical protein ENH85_00490 [Candidatus Scalindua sp.]|nr:hypothetical protein [Candidatus Scalindua sp.]
MWRAFWLILIIILTIWVVNNWVEEPTEVPVPGNIVEISMISGNTLMGIYPPSEIRTRVLGAIIDKIIHCESGGNPKVCNKEYGCKAGMGLFQLIPSTVKYCEKKLGKSIDPFNAEDNYECGVWLLENEGTRHWGTVDTIWGSYNCWSE